VNHGTTPIQHLIPKWPRLSSAEKRCLYELYGRILWRIIWCKFSRLLGLIIIPIRSLGKCRRGHWRTHCCNSEFWAVCAFFYPLGGVGVTVAGTANFIAGMTMFGVGSVGYGLSVFMIVQTCIPSDLFNREVTIHVEPRHGLVKNGCF
jgi:hypothetical protein